MSQVDQSYLKNPPQIFLFATQEGNHPLNSFNNKTIHTAHTKKLGESNEPCHNNGTHQHHYYCQVQYLLSFMPDRFVCRKKRKLCNWNNIMEKVVLTQQVQEEWEYKRFKANQNNIIRENWEENNEDGDDETTQTKK